MLVELLIFELYQKSHQVYYHFCVNVWTTLGENLVLTITLPDLQHRIAPLGPLCLGSHQSSGCSSLPPALASGVGGSSQLPPLTSGLGWLLRVSARGLRREAASPGHP